MLLHILALVMKHEFWMNIFSLTQRDENGEFLISYNDNMNKTLMSKKPWIEIIIWKNDYLQLISHRKRRRGRNCLRVQRKAVRKKKGEEESKEKGKRKKEIEETL